MNEQSTITLIIIIVTCLVSIPAFGNRSMMTRLIFTPYVIKRRNEWHRFLTSGFLHANWLHLIFNMYVLWMFGSITETFFKNYFGGAGAILYIVMYLLGVILAEAYSYFRHQDHPGYSSLGASGAVSAVVFASIMFLPQNKIFFIFLPIPMPAFLFGLLYLLYSWYMANKGADNIGHHAHFFGAVFGFIFPALLKPQLFIIFIQQVANAY